MTASSGDVGGADVTSFSPSHQQQIDWLEMARRKRVFHLLIEVDITDIRQWRRDERRAGRAVPSVTAILVWALGRAIGEDRSIHAIRAGRRRVAFHEVDVTILVERGDGQAPLARIIRTVNHKTAAGLTDEIAGAKPADGAATGAGLRLWLLVPARLRRAIWSALLRDPQRRKRLTGTAAFTSVAMIRRGVSWGIPLTISTICMGVGGITERVSFVGPSSDRRVEPREFLAVTLTFDHDIVDGAQAARFSARLKNVIESEFLATTSDGFAS